MKRVLKLINIQKYKESITDLLDFNVLDEEGFMKDLLSFAKKKDPAIESYYELFDWLCSESKVSLLTEDEAEYLLKLKEMNGFSAIKLEDEQTEIRYFDDANDIWHTKIVTDHIIVGFINDEPVMKVRIPSDLKFKKVLYNVVYTLKELGL